VLTKGQPIVLLADRGPHSRVPERAHSQRKNLVKQAAVGFTLRTAFDEGLQLALATVN